MPTDTKKFTAALSNSWNSDKKASQGGYKSNSGTGATATSRSGTFKFSGLSALKGTVITQITWYLQYASAGKSAKKKLTFTSPSFDFTSGVTAYNNNETRTLSTTGTLFKTIVNTINSGADELKLTMYNGETKTTHTDSAGGSYTENYLHVTSSYFNITYETSIPNYVFTNIRSSKTYPGGAMTADTSLNCTVSTSTVHSSNYTAYRAFDNNDSTCWASSGSDAAPHVVIKMPEALYDCTVYLKNRTHASYNIGGFINGTIEGSNDGTNFTALKTFSNRDGATSGFQDSYSLGNASTAYQWIRVKASSWDKTENTYACMAQMNVSGYSIPISGAWQEVTAYVYSDGAWALAAPSVYTNSQWLPG